MRRGTRHGRPCSVGIVVAGALPLGSSSGCCVHCMLCAVRAAARCGHSRPRRPSRSTASAVVYATRGLCWWWWVIFNRVFTAGARFTVRASARDVPVPVRRALCKPSLAVYLLAYLYMGLGFETAGSLLTAWIWKFFFFVELAGCGVCVCSHAQVQLRWR